MPARVVIGASFGDEGKGLTTDWLCSLYDDVDIVVRFNGGAQAGHTVVTPDGARHVFSHYGSGTFCGKPTFLSQFFICNPILFLKETEELAAVGMDPDYPMVYAHPNCLVTTFADMKINQRIEDARGDKRHGSVGVGINETIERSGVSELKITMSDLWNGVPLDARLTEICGPYAKFRTGKPIDQPDAMIQEFIQRCARFAHMVNPLGIQQCKNPVFEGAQGLLLDQNNKQFFPHLTRSNTGMTNVRRLCADAGIPDNEITIYYVSRTYLTRHGAGRLPGEDRSMCFPDDTNGDHAYQGKLRFASLDVPPLRARIRADAAGAKFGLVLTHCDQQPDSWAWDGFQPFRAFGPTRQHVEMP